MATKRSPIVQWFLNVSPLNWLLAALPLAAVLHFAQAPDLWVFLASGLAIIPLAGLMGRATENLAETMGSGVGGLLNATFGNAAELIIALMVLRKGPAMYPLVKASITGSIIGNVLLVLGLAVLLGGFRHPRQTFNRTAAGTGTTLLALACTGLIVPTIFFYVFRADPQLLQAHERENIASLSEEIALILAGVYLVSLLFTLRTHRHLFAEKDGEIPGHGPEWSRRKSLSVLTLATAGVAVMSEFLVDSVDKAGRTMGLSEVFIGVIVVAIIGNAAEYSTAVLMAMKNRMGLAVNIALGSSIQIALFVAPALVLASVLMGHHPHLDLHFTLMETLVIVLSVALLALIVMDGETHWMEGVLLLAVYFIFGLAFYHLPEVAH
jgi:Ca2+:H+ antiporter